MIPRTIEHTEIDGIGFSLISIVPLEEWLQARYGGMDKFDKLSHRDKEKIFLRWKYGFTDEWANEELELTEKQTLFQFKDSDLSDLSEAVKFHIQHKRNFNRICYETKKRIGLIRQKNPLVDKVIQEFDAKEY